MLDSDLVIDRMIAKRKGLNLSQRDLANKAGVSFEYVNKIESGRQFPSLGMLERLADALTMSVKELFFGADLDSKMYLLPELSARFDRWTPASQKVFLEMMKSAEAMDTDLKLKRGNLVSEKW